MLPEGRRPEGNIAQLRGIIFQCWSRLTVWLPRVWDQLRPLRSITSMGTFTFTFYPSLLENNNSTCAALCGHVRDGQITPPFVIELQITNYSDVE